MNLPRQGDLWVKGRASSGNMVPAEPHQPADLAVVKRMLPHFVAEPGCQGGVICMAMRICCCPLGCPRCGESRQNDQ